MPPAEPKRQRIVEAMQARLLTINGGDNYWTDLSSAKVFVWRDSEIQDHEIPCVVIRDTNEPTKPRSTGGVGGGTVEGALNVEWYAYIKGPDGCTPADVATLARHLQADLIKCIGTDQSWGVTNAQTSLMEKDMIVEAGNKRVAFAYIRLEVRVPHNRFDYAN